MTRRALFRHDCWATEDEECEPDCPLCAAVGKEKRRNNIRPQLGGSNPPRAGKPGEDYPGGRSAQWGR